MMNQSLLRRVALLISLSLGLAASDAKAAFIGSFGFNGNTPSANPTNALATATNFTFSNMTSNGNATGGFIGVGSVGTPFTTTTLTLGAATGFTISNATFGTFTQTAAAVLTSTGTIGSVVVSRAFTILGTFSGGPVGAATPASITLSFTQNGGPGTSISSSGTLDIPPTGAVPEPASMVMLGMGLVSVGGVAMRRRMAK